VAGCPLNNFSFDAYTVPIIEYEIDVRDVAGLESARHSEPSGV